MRWKKRLFSGWNRVNGFVGTEDCVRISLLAHVFMVDVNRSADVPSRIVENADFRIRIS